MTTTTTNNTFFVGGLYVGMAVATVVTITGLFTGVSATTIGVRMALALATFAFLGWIAEIMIAQMTQPIEEKGKDTAENENELGTEIDVVLPSTDDEELSE